MNPVERFGFFFGTTYYWIWIELSYTKDAHYHFKLHKVVKRGKDENNPSSLYYLYIPKKIRIKLRHSLGDEHFRYGGL